MAAPRAVGDTYPDATQRTTGWIGRVVRVRRVEPFVSTEYAWSCPHVHDTKREALACARNAPAQED